MASYRCVKCWHGVDHITGPHSPYCPLCGGKLVPEALRFLYRKVVWLAAIVALVLAIILYRLWTK
jgi:hypothetical protein